MENKTIVVNLFAGPGAGKSTGAAYIFAMLKMHDIDCELVTEFAKDMVWEQNKTVIDNQLYVFGTQSFRISRCIGKVRVIVTDSPLLLSGLYCNPKEPYYKDFMRTINKEFNKYDNYNFFIERTKPYNPNGRFQNEEESKELDQKIRELLANTPAGYVSVLGNKKGYDIIVQDVLGALGIFEEKVMDD